MAVRIGTLKCVVTITSSRRGTASMRQEGPDRPALEFALPAQSSVSQSGPIPSETATDRGQAARDHDEGQVRNADPRRVAERVYDLLRDEIAIAKMRGG